MIVIQGGWVCEACADLDFSGFVKADKDFPEKGTGVMDDMELVPGNGRGNVKQLSARASLMISYAVCAAPDNLPDLMKSRTQPKR